MSWPNGIDIGQKIRHVEQSPLIYKIYLYVKWFASYSRHPISRNSPNLLNEALPHMSYVIQKVTTPTFLFLYPPITDISYSGNRRESNVFARPPPGGLTLTLTSDSVPPRFARVPKYYSSVYVCVSVI